MGGGTDQFQWDMPMPNYNSQSLPVPKFNVLSNNLWKHLDSEYLCPLRGWAAQVALTEQLTGEYGTESPKRMHTIELNCQRSFMDSANCP